MIKNDKRYILNLVEDLSESIKGYLESKEFILLDRKDCENYEELSYILIDSEDEVINVYNDYSIDQYNINLIGIGNFVDTKNFLIHQGKLVINEEMVENDLGKVILDNFFNHSHTLYLEDSYLGFSEEIKSIKLTNHLLAGHYIDELCLSAFEKKFNLVSLRSFLDHSIYYLTYLRQAGLSGVPIEIDYGYGPTQFVVNIHVSVYEFVAEYLYDSFGTVNSEDPLNYLMSIIKGTSDFLEIVYLQDSNKLILRGYWSINGYSFKGVSFNNILTSKQIKEMVELSSSNYSELNNNEKLNQEKFDSLREKDLPGGFLELIDDEDEESSFNDDPLEALNLVAIVATKFEEENPNKTISDISEEELVEIVKGHNEDLASKISVKDMKKLEKQVKKSKSAKLIAEEVNRVKGKIEEDDKFKTNLADKLAEDIAKKVSGKFDEESINKVLGSKDEADQNTLVKGGKEAADNFKSVVSGHKEDEKGNFIARFSSGLNEEIKKTNLKSSSSKSGGMEIRNLINSTVHSLEKDEQMNPHFKHFLTKNISEKYSKMIEEFANAQGVDPTNLGEEQIEEFNQKELPEILQNLLNNQEEIEKFQEQIEKNTLDEDILNEQVIQNNKLKKLLKEKLDELNKLKAEKNDNENEITEEEIKEVIKEVVKNEIENEVKEKGIQGAKDDIIVSISELVTDKEEVSELVNTSIKDSKKEENKEVLKILKESNRKNEVQDEASAKDKSSENSYEKKVIEQKLKEANFNNKKLEDKVKALEIKLNTLQETNAKVNEVQQKVEDAVNEKLKELNAEGSDPDILSIEEKNKLIEELQNGSISSEDSQKLSVSLQKESELIEKAKEANVIIKKINIEMSQKEAVFNSELNKFQKVIKAKDLVVDKAKSTMKMLVAKSTQEKKLLNDKIIDLNKRISDDKSQDMKELIRKIKSENDELKKQQTDLKNQLDTTDARVEKELLKTEQKISNEGKLEIDKLKNKLKNLMANAERDKKTLQKHYDETKQSEGKLKNQTTALIAKLREFELQIKGLKEENQKLVQTDKATESPKEIQLEKELNNSKEQIAELQKKMIEMSEKFKNAEIKASETSKVANVSKEKKMEKDMSRLRMELSKAKESSADQRKELLKLKGENTALKNKLKALEKNKKVA